MRLALVVALTVGSASLFVARGNAAPQGGARSASDPALALAALDRKIADLDSEAVGRSSHLG